MPLLELALTLTVGGFCVFLAGIGVRVLRADKKNFEKNRRRGSSLREIFSGEVSTFRDGVRDYHVRAGLVLDRKNNKWREQGTFSEEAIDTVLKKQE